MGPNRFVKREGEPSGNGWRKGPGEERNARKKLGAVKRGVRTVGGEGLYPDP